MKDKIIDMLAEEGLNVAFNDGSISSTTLELLKKLDDPNLILYNLFRIIAGKDGFLTNRKLSSDEEKVLVGSMKQDVEKVKVSAICRATSIKETIDKNKPKMPELEGVGMLGAVRITVQDLGDKVYKLEKDFERIARKINIFSGEIAGINETSGSMEKYNKNLVDKFKKLENETIEKLNLLKGKLNGIMTSRIQALEDGLANEINERKENTLSETPSESSSAVLEVNSGLFVTFPSGKELNTMNIESIEYNESDGHWTGEATMISGATHKLFSHPDKDEVVKTVDNLLS